MSKHTDSDAALGRLTAAMKDAARRAEADTTASTAQRHAAVLDAARKAS
jgi:hypothetical protein